MDSRTSPSTALLTRRPKPLISHSSRLSLRPELPASAPILKNEGWIAAEVALNQCLTDWEALLLRQTPHGERETRAWPVTLVSTASTMATGAQRCTLSGGTMSHRRCLDHEQIMMTWTTALTGTPGPLVERDLIVSRTSEEALSDVATHLTLVTGDALLSGTRHETQHTIATGTQHPCIHTMFTQPTRATRPTTGRHINLNLRSIMTVHDTIRKGRSSMSSSAQPELLTKVVTASEPRNNLPPRSGLPVTRWHPTTETTNRPSNTARNNQNSTPPSITETLQSPRRSVTK